MVIRIVSLSLLITLLTGSCKGAALCDLKDESGDSKHAPFEIWLCDSESDEEDDREGRVALFATMPAAILTTLLEVRCVFDDCGRVSSHHGLDFARAPPILHLIGSRV
jgi:hypothetical protein